MTVDVAGRGAHTLCEVEKWHFAPVRRLQGPELHHHKELIPPATPIKGPGPPLRPQDLH